jgi:molybdopterin-containing oxidoreductase family membrane subunit
MVSAELKVSMALSKQFAGSVVQVVALLIAFTVYFLNTVFPRVFRIGTTVFASALVVAILWITRFLIVVPSLTRPYLPYPPGSYTPTWVEWSLVMGTFAMVALLFMLFTKFFPVIPLSEMEKAEEQLG